MQVLGQNADMSDLQRIMLRSSNKMDDARQQNMTVRGCENAALLNCLDHCNVLQQPCCSHWLLTIAICMQRWAVYECCKLLSEYSAEYEALQQAMKSRSSVAECIRAIELAGS